MKNAYRDIAGLINPEYADQQLRGWEIIWGIKPNFKNKHYCVTVRFKNYYFKTARKAKVFYKKILSLGYVKVRFFIIKKGRFNLKMSYNGLDSFKYRQIGKSNIQRNFFKLRFNGEVFIDEARGIV